VGRPKKQAQDRVKKEGFSAPQYLVAAARKAAKLDEGNDFSRWIVAAIREKLEHDEPGLMAKMRAEMQAAAVRDYPLPDWEDLKTAERAPPTGADLGSQAIAAALKKKTGGR
jgi:hypothetical protein